MPEITKFIEYNNHKQYQESLRNVEPVDVDEERSKQMFDAREEIKRRTLQWGRQLNLGNTKCGS